MISGTYSTSNTSYTGVGVCPSASSSVQGFTVSGNDFKLYPGGNSEVIFTRVP